MAQEVAATDPRQRAIALAGQLDDVEVLAKEARDRGGDLLMALLRMGCESAIKRARSEVTRHAVHGPRKAAGYVPPDGTGAGLAARLRAIDPAYDWALPNGAQLGEACVADLEHAIGTHKARAAGHIGHIKFYGTLIARMRRAQAHRVSDVLGPRELKQLSDQSGIGDHHDQ